MCVCSCVQNHAQAIKDAVDFFFLLQYNIRADFSWNWGSWWFMKCKSTGILSKKTYTGETKVIPVAPDDILGSYETKLSFR